MRLIKSKTSRKKHQEQKINHCYFFIDNIRHNILSISLLVTSLRYCSKRQKMISHLAKSILMQSIFVTPYFTRKMAPLLLYFFKQCNRSSVLALSGQSGTCMISWKLLIRKQIEGANWSSPGALSWASATSALPADCISVAIMLSQFSLNKV
jgi:hypothetical protein